MNKKPSLSDALLGVESRNSPAAEAQESVPQADPVANKVANPRPPSRQGKKTIAGHFDPAVSRQLRALGLESDRSVQDLLSEAINGLFEKYGKPPIA